MKKCCLLILIGLVSACSTVNSLNSSAGNNKQVVIDTLLINGEVYDGNSEQAQRLNVGICHEKICYLGSEQPSASQVVDASGLIITPGFIDPHTHSLEELLSADKNDNLNYRFQGVTTVFVGNDGEGQPNVKVIGMKLTKNGIGTNVAMLAGHNAIRIQVMGAVDRAPTANELDKMKALLKKALDQGAFGFSTGLYYVPGIYSRTDEVLSLAKVAAEYGVVYESHIRDEGSFNIGFTAAIEEFIHIIKEAKINGHIGHIKALGVDVWGDSDIAINMIEKAQAEGMDITADQYPWQASGTFLHSAVVPKWAMEGGRDATIKRLKQLSDRSQILKDIQENIRKRGGADRLLVTASGEKDWLGKDLKIIAKQMKLSPAEAVIEMVLTERTRVASFNMNADDVENFMKKSWVVTSSDGTNGHPRKYASFPQKYQRYVVERNVLKTSTFISQSSSATAKIFGLSDRGKIQLGYKADINVIALNRFKANADFSNWNKLSSGVVHQWINGRASIYDNKVVNKLSGKVLFN